MTTNEREAANKGAARTFDKASRSRLFGKLDLKRILAMSAVMVMHTMAVGVMLLPAKPLAATSLPPPEPPWVDVGQAPPPPPPPPQPKPKPTPPPVSPVPFVPVVAPPPPVAPVSQAPILVATTREASPEIGVFSPTIVDPPATVSGNLAESALKVLRAPPPRFPTYLTRSGFSGTVEFSVLVGINGTAQEIKLMKSSGNRKLDQSTLAHIKRHWRFKAPEVDGQPVSGWGRGKITFTMEG